MALPQESRGLLEAAGAQLLYTGVGKVNAAAALARRLAEMRCSGAAQPLVVNMGTAGSRRSPRTRWWPAIASRSVTWT